MKRQRWWHRLRGHKITTPPFNPADYPPEKVAMAATSVRDVCSCGDQWVFSALVFNEFYIPANP